MRLPLSFKLGSGKKLWTVKTAVLPGDALHDAYHGACKKCGAILDRCPECDHRAPVLDRQEVEGFWLEETRTIYVNGDTPDELQWWIHRHEAWHATIDWYDVMFR